MLFLSGFGEIIIEHPFILIIALVTSSSRLVILFPVLVNTGNCFRYQKKKSADLVITYSAEG